MATLLVFEEEEGEEEKQRHKTNLVLGTGSGLALASLEELREGGKGGKRRSGQVMM